MKKIIVDEGIILYSFRYALGRKTYATKDVSDCIIKNWELLTNNLKGIIIKEIKIAIEKNNAGMSIDVRFWERILELK